MATVADLSPILRQPALDAHGSSPVVPGRGQPLAGEALREATARPWPVLSGDLRGAIAENDAEAIVSLIREAETEHPQWEQPMLAADVRLAREKLGRLVRAAETSASLLSGFVIGQRPDGPASSPSTSPTKVGQHPKRRLVLFHANNGQPGPPATKDESLDLMRTVKTFLTQHHADLPPRVHDELTELVAGLHRGLLDDTSQRADAESPVAWPERISGKPPTTSERRRRGGDDDGARHHGAKSPLEELADGGDDGFPLVEPPAAIAERGDDPQRPETRKLDLSSSGGDDRHDDGHVRSDTADAAGGPVSSVLSSSRDPQQEDSPQNEVDVDEWRHRMNLRAAEVAARADALCEQLTARGKLLFTRVDREHAATDDLSPTELTLHARAYAGLAVAPEGTALVGAATGTPFGLADDFAAFVDRRVLRVVEFTVAVGRIESDEAEQRRVVVQQWREATRTLRKVSKGFAKTMRAMAAFCDAMALAETEEREKLMAVEDGRRCEITAELQLVHAFARRGYERRVRAAQAMDAIAFSENVVRQQLQDTYAAELVRVRSEAWARLEIEVASSFRGSVTAQPQELMDSFSQRQHSLSASPNASVARSRAAHGTVQSPRGQGTARQSRRSLGRRDDGDELDAALRGEPVSSPLAALDSDDDFIEIVDSHEPAPASAAPRKEGHKDSRTSDGLDEAAGHHLTALESLADREEE